MGEARGLTTANGRTGSKRRERNAKGVGIETREKAEDVHFSHQLE